MDKKTKAAVSHHEREVAELRADRELVPNISKLPCNLSTTRMIVAAGLLALRTVAEATHQHAAA